MKARPLTRKTIKWGGVLATVAEISRSRMSPEQLEELKKWRKEHRWSANQLRHSAATHLRNEFGIEAARVVLGHSSAEVTEIYAELDMAKAAEIMGRVG
jgi:integrase